MPNLTPALLGEDKQTVKDIAYEAPAYDNDTTAFITNTLASGAIIERGSNASGEYTKFADGTQIEISVKDIEISFLDSSRLSGVLSLPLAFLDTSYIAVASRITANSDATESLGAAVDISATTTSTLTAVIFSNDGDTFIAGDKARIKFIAIGRWK